MASKAKRIPKASGFVKPGFEHVQDVFRQSIERGVERGGSFAAYYRGELVVNLWGGFADEDARRPWQHNTASNFYSSSKSVSAMVMAHLVERGLVKYEQPVCSYWPQFAQNGKENITLKQILSLKAGLPVLSEPFKLCLLRDDPQRLEQLLAEQKPWNTGDCAAYSPVVIGLYLDQIVKKVDPQQRGLAEYFQAEIAQPFGIDFHIGVPKSEFWRKARQEVTVRGEEYKKYQLQMASNPNIDQDLMVTAATQPSDFLRNSYINNPDFAELPCGASHGVGSAEGMAKLHGILANGGGTVDGRRLLSEDTIEMLQTPLSIGPEKMFGIDLFYGCGMELLPVLEGGKLHYNIGHGGFGGQFAVADVKHKTGWAYCTNYLDPRIMLTGSTKWRALEKVLFECVHALEGTTVSRKHIDKASELRETLQRLKSRL
ncbi:beta-lactamase domain-containing protein 2-like [Littorina saxatilis]|uniref:beta-lactamase domain-containing protein 2-like n=1 Tax=Littorina saxatilis TaxID=31220 RepID=UPI0038B5D256